MKNLVALLVVAVMALIGVVIWLTLPVRVTLDDLLKATQAKYWLYRLPDSYKPTDTIGVEVTTLESTKRSGGASGFQPGQLLKVFLIPNEDNTAYRWAIVGDKATISSSIPNPFAKNGSHAHPVIGSRLNDNVLMQGIQSSDNEEPPSIRIVIRNE